MNPIPPLPVAVSNELLQHSADPCAIFSPASTEPIWSNLAWNQATALRSQSTSSQSTPPQLAELHKLLFAPPKADSAEQAIHPSSQSQTAEPSSPLQLELPHSQATATIVRYSANEQDYAAVLLRHHRSSPHAHASHSAAANSDHLTGLPGREFIEGRIEQRHNGGPSDSLPPFALLFIDLDGFKLVNDQYGHIVGDRVLAVVARRLAGAVRGSDVIARYGGDEFLVLVENIRQPSETAPVIARLRQAAELPVRIDSRSLHVSASIGMAHSLEEWHNVSDLIALADGRMYADKKAT